MGNVSKTSDLIRKGIIRDQNELSEFPFKNYSVPVDGFLKPNQEKVFPAHPDTQMQHELIEKLRLEEMRKSMTPKEFEENILAKCNPRNCRNCVMMSTKEFFTSPDFNYCCGEGDVYHILEPDKHVCDNFKSFF